MRRLFLYAAGLIFGCLLFGCTQQIENQKNDRPSTAPTVAVRSYSVRDIGKPGVPALTPKQRSLVHQILLELPASKRARIRFVFAGPEVRRFDTEFYVLDPGTAPPNGAVPGGIQMFRVLNGACNLFYDPVRNYVFAGTGCGVDPEITG